MLCAPLFSQAHYSLTVPKFDISSFITTYFPIPFLFVLLFGYKFLKGSKVVNLMDMDFVSDPSSDIVDKV